MSQPVRLPSHGFSKSIEEFLEDLAESLQVPASRYEAAIRSYKSVGEWLNRDASPLKVARPQVYIQGSFCLGTAIRPASDDEDYDVDLVCELFLSKGAMTQAQFKQLLGQELSAYAKAHGMEPPTEGRRCWTLNYADGAQFHLDTLGAIPDGQSYRRRLEQRGLSSDWGLTAIAIPDREHPLYRTITDDWPHSNPKGYAGWFQSRIASVFKARRERLALEARAKVEEIPEHTVRTPLQLAIQILKHHRDLMFLQNNDNKPISIILTTLSAHAYQQETTIAAALYSILARMDQFIEDRDGVSWIPNPTDPAENFADRWQTHPQRKRAFYDWLEQARRDFQGAATAANRAEAATILQPRMGKRLVEAALARRGGARAAGNLGSLLLKGSLGRVLQARHRQAPPWHYLEQGQVQIARAIVTRPGFRPAEYTNDGSSLPKNCGLQFEASTNIPGSYKVYWQIVNTGLEAERANDQRGGFNEGIVSPGWLTHQETTRYAGSHSIECFIVKDGLLAARSGQFIVNIV